MTKLILNNVVSKVIRQLREEKGMSQELLGFEADLHRTYISLLERNKRKPTLETIFAIAKALKIKPSLIVKQIEDNSDY